MIYLPGTKVICLTYSELVPKILSAENYRQLKVRGKVKVHGRNGRESESLIEFGSLRAGDKDKVIETYGDPRVYMASQPLLALVEVDEKARQFYLSHNINPGGPHRDLPLSYQLRYSRQCDWLNAIQKALENKKSTKAVLQISIEELWARFSKLINNDDFGIEHDLPTSVDRLKRRYRLYRDKGYAGLIEPKFGNDYARVVTPKIEALIISLFVKQDYKPYMNEVCASYNRFIRGEEQIVNVHPESGGEVFDPMDFYVAAKGKKKGKAAKGNNTPVLTVPYELGESTVDYYLKKPVNVAVINKLKMKKIQYDSQYRPTTKRIASYYAFSKLTMDDIDLPFQGPDGTRIVKSYQVYDTASGAIVGVAFSKDKNVDLIMESMRDMFRLIVSKNWGMPWEIEMERHLTSAMKGKTDKDTGDVIEAGIFTPGAVFPATRICQSPHEKRAEGFIRKKKYAQQRKRPGFQGRFYAKNLTNRLNEDDKPLRQAYEVIVENELADIDAHNNELHPKQDLYPGLTRWQVLEQYQNPALPKFLPHQVIQFIGYSTATSIRAGVARVMYGDYMLPDINLLSKQHYNGEITAYYLPDAQGSVNSVFLFEDGQFLCEAAYKEGFHEAVIERTIDDERIMQQQWGQQKAFDAMVKRGLNALVPVAVMKPDCSRQVAGGRPQIAVSRPQVAETEYLLPKQTGNSAIMDI